MIQWRCCSFAELSLEQLYAIIAAREAVFIVEQDCPYLDADGVDHDSRHLVAWQRDQVAAYARLVEPGIKYREPSIGRVITSGEFRGQGLGRELLQRALEDLSQRYPDMGVRISAQQYLERFYTEFGFQRVSDPYDEDGIPHIEMLKQ